MTPDDASRNVLTSRGDEHMLSDAVLADIARPSPTQAMIVATAWPSLAVESRLQVIAAIQGNGVSRSTPDWLLDLALQDAAAIVRYWAARSAYFREQGPLDFNEKSDDGRFSRKPAAPEDVSRVRAARNDPSELVRLSVERLGFLGGDELTSMPQQQRLIAIRNQAHPSFSSFIDWLCKAGEAGIPDDDQAACSSELFSLPDMHEQMKRDDFEDGTTAYYEGEALNKAWTLLKSKAGPRLTAELVFVLPVKRGLVTIKAEQLAAMPERVLGALLHRRSEGKTFLELAELIRKHPDRFPPDVVKSLKRDDEDYISVPDEDERTEHRLKTALDRQAATIETLLLLRREVASLQQRLDQSHEVATRKRGIFG